MKNRSTKQRALPQDCINNIINGVHNIFRVSDFTHCFYRYPARFSPLFARGIINAFTKPGDLIFDPFMGGGTTLVEARALGRRSIGTDISSLAAFVSRVKTLNLSENDFSILDDWALSLPQRLNIQLKARSNIEPFEKYYQNNLTRKSTWRIKKLIEQSIETTKILPKRYLQDFARCVILATAQWGLDCRRKVPTSDEFRSHVIADFRKMIYGARQFSDALKQKSDIITSKAKYQSICLQKSAMDIGDIIYLRKHAPKLILTSPPYPGIHVLYHRWQIQSRRETPAPFWIANCQDGTGSSYYTFGDRKQKELYAYYNNLYKCFSSISTICNRNTLLVQMVGFSDVSWQLPLYLDSLEKAGFREINYPEIACSSDNRLWRIVPNRKWYAENTESNIIAKEVVLFHITH